MEPLFVGLAVVVLLLSIWFWPHCARPMLRSRQAGPITTRLLRAVTAYTVAAEVVFIAVTLATGQPSRLLWVGAGLPWMIVVGLPYLDDYRTLLRLTGGR